MLSNIGTPSIIFLLLFVVMIGAAFFIYKNFKNK